jgi:S-adenosylmethionine hydrolase
MASPGRIITLLTDFGLRDHFVAVMKGVMLSLNPDLTLVDVSHLIPPQDFHGASLWDRRILALGAIHLAVVDPGVGTGKGAEVSAGGHFLWRLTMAC